MKNNSVLLESPTKSIAKIILNKPQIHNAFDEDLIVLLTNILQQVDKDPSVRVVLLTGNGPSFSAGADLNWMKRMASYSEAQNLQDALKLATLMQTLHELSKPSIALINGAAFGGGVGLVACCDIAIAIETAEFSFSEVKIGLIPAVISPYIIQALGPRIAKKLFMTAEKIPALQAKQLGLVDEVVNAEDLPSICNDYCNMLLKNSPNAMSQAKRLVNAVSYHPINDELSKMTAQWIASCRVSKEGQAGLQAFLEKKPPVWIV